MKRREYPATVGPNQTHTAAMPAPALTLSPSLQTALTAVPAGIETMHLVCFRLAGEEMAVPVEAVVEVVRGSAVNPITDSTRYLAGMMPYRTETIPVVHLKRWLDLQADDAVEVPRVIIMTRGGKLFGLAVDEVTQVLRGDRHRLLEPAAGDGRRRFLAGYYDDDGRRIPVLECRHLPEL